MSIENFKSQLDNYYISRFKEEIKDTRLNSNREYPLKNIISEVIKEFLIKEGFNVLDLYRANIENNIIVFEYNYSSYAGNYIRVYLDKYLFINEIEIVTKVFEYNNSSEEKRIGTFLKNWDTEVFVATDYIHLNMEYTLDIGRKTIGAKVLKHEDNTIFNLYHDNSVYHYITEDKDIGDSIGIIISFSIVKGKKEKEDQQQ